MTRVRELNVAIKRRLKNKAAPAGRLDWVGRAPRWRLNLLQSEISMLKECVSYFMVENELETDVRYLKLLEKINSTSDKIETPLTEAVASFPLLDLGDENE